MTWKAHAQWKLAVSKALRSWFVRIMVSVKKHAFYEWILTTSESRHRSRQSSNGLALLFSFIRRKSRCCCLEAMHLWRVQTLQKANIRASNILIRSLSLGRVRNSLKCRLVRSLLRHFLKWKRRLVTARKCLLRCLLHSHLRQVSFQIMLEFSFSYALFISWE